MLCGFPASAPFPKFVIHCGALWHELRKQGGTSNPMILVPLFDLKFLHEFAATSAGTSNRRHLCQRKESRADISSARDLHDARDRAMREHPPLMQHDDLVVLRNFVDEMR